MVTSSSPWHHWRGCGRHRPSSVAEQAHPKCHSFIDLHTAPRSKGHCPVSVSFTINVFCRIPASHSIAFSDTALLPKMCWCNLALSSQWILQSTPSRQTNTNSGHLLSVGTTPMVYSPISPIYTCKRCAVWKKCSFLCTKLFHHMPRKGSTW